MAKSSRFIRLSADDQGRWTAKFPPTVLFRPVDLVLIRRALTIGYRRYRQEAKIESIRKAEAKQSSGDEKETRDD